MITLVTEIAGAAYITRLIVALVDRLEKPKKKPLTPAGQSSSARGI